MGAAIVVHVIELAAPARSGCADAALRDLLARELGRPADLARDPHGKPYLVGGELAFNVAHSGELAAIAVAPGGCELGVDLEQHRPLHDAAAIARRFFTAGEAAVVAAAVAAGDATAFFRLWCRKEAWVKARGRGLRLPLDTVDVREPPDGWLLEDLAVGAGYSAAVACAGGPATVRLLVRDR